MNFFLGGGDHFRGNFKAAKAETAISLLKYKLNSIGF
jgi:hypothetical protein